MKTITARDEGDIVRRMGHPLGGHAATRDHRQRVRLIARYPDKTAHWLSEQLGIKPVTIREHCITWGLKIADFDPSDPEQVKRHRRMAKKKKAD